MRLSENTEVLMLTVPQVAKALQIARGRAYELVARGVIPSVRLGKSIRVPRDALLEWMEQETRKERAGGR